MVETPLKRRSLLKASAAGAAALCWSPTGHLRARRARAADAGPFELRFRQVHLDFHTSEHVKDIGADFDPQAFAATLKRAHVDSVTVFGRCHHGYIYYDTQKFPERKHPHLVRKDLLKEQIEACHKQNIRAPIYITIQWDQFTAEAHPEWRQVTESGALEGRPPYEPGFYRRLCLNSPYADFVKTHIDELFQLVSVDGLFLDIVHAQDCSCVRCRREMHARGIDPAKADLRKAFGAQVTNRWKEELTAFIRRRSKGCSIFYNGGHVGPGIRATAKTYSHLELESLPSGGWGYLHFPLTARYARTLGQQALGMTGKFHTSWGDFHSLKNRPALEFECFQMLALGAKCSVGDQLHPRGKLDAATYELIGAVYESVEKKEPWCKGARALVDIGVLSPEESAPTGGRTPPSTRGVVRMLQEGAHQFDIVDSQSDFGSYRVLVLPDEIVVEAKLAEKLGRFLRGGGAVLTSYKSALGPHAGRVLGVRVKGDAPFSPDFIRARSKLGKGLPQTELVMYLQGLEIAPAGKGEVLADVVVPYFNRSYRQFFSHRHTPSAGQVGYAGVVQTGRVIAFAHPVFTQYAKNAPRWVKLLVLNALELLLPEPLVRHDGPTTLIATLNEQRAHKRTVLHLLHYVPERRGDDFDVIEDVLPLFDLKVSVRTGKAPNQVVAVPQERPVPFAFKNGRTEITVPRLVGHEMIAFEMT
jgi:hypothetical protein